MTPDMLTCWPGLIDPAGGPGGGEYALAFNRRRTARVLVIPALFDEHNRLRRFLVETMRALDAAGVDSFLPDLPGTNESLATLAAQSLESWQASVAAAARHFNTSHVLAVRGGALLAPDLPGWSFAATSGAALLRKLLRARILTAREAGREETQEDLLALGQREGLDLAGYHLSPRLLAGLADALPAGHLTPITQADLGGSSLWLRAEPDEDPAQSAALARRLAHDLTDDLSGPSDSKVRL